MIITKQNVWGEKTERRTVMKVMLNPNVLCQKSSTPNSRNVSFRQNIPPELQIWLYKVYSPFIQMLEDRGLKIAFEFCEKEQKGLVSIFRKSDREKILSKVFLEQAASLEHPGSWIEPVNTAVASVLKKGMTAELELLLTPAI